MRAGRLVPILIGAASIGTGGCDEHEHPVQPTMGSVTVSVYDRGQEEWPVADVRVALTPTDLVVSTDENGLAVFEVVAGEYFVDARVCCVGPGLIEHHVPVTVEVGKEAEVSLWACLPCLAE